MSTKPGAIQYAFFLGVEIETPLASVAIDNGEIDPLDLPLELDAANMAFRAVSKGFGDQSVTPKNRLIAYLQKHYPDFKKEQVKRIATVANPDKTTGRKKIGKD